MAFKILLRYLKSSFQSPNVIKWSIWIAFATSGYFQVGNYIQSLWKTVRTDNEAKLNGGVEATTTFLASLAVFSIGYLDTNWKRLGNPLIILVSFFSGIVLYIMATTEIIWITYAGNY